MLYNDDMGNEEQGLGMQAILGQMKDRLRRGEIMTRVSTGRWPSGFERVRDFGQNKPTSIARSEQLVSSEKIERVNRRVDAIRELLFLHGQDGTVLPDSQEMVEEGYRTEEELKRLFWHSTDSFFCQADKQPPASQDIKTGWKLYLSAHDDDIGVYMDFGFDDLFELEMRFRVSEPSQELIGKIVRNELTDEEREEFLESREAPAALDYRSSRLPLEQMTQEEYEVVVHYLDIYAQTVGKTL